MNQVRLNVVAVVAAAVFLLGCSAQQEPIASLDAPHSYAEERGRAAVLAPNAYDPPIRISSVNLRVDSDVAFRDGEGPGNNVWIRAYERELGVQVHVRWGSNDPNKFNLMVASGDLPDVFAIPNLDAPAVFDHLVRAGKLADITSAYEEHATPLLRELLLEDGGAVMNAIRQEGRLYSIPYYEDTSVHGTCLWVREDWRRRLGLPEPRTMHDVLAISRAFSSDDPDGNGEDDTYGLYLNKLDSWLTNYTGFFNGYHAYPNNVWVEREGRLVNGRVLSGMTEPLRELQRMYREGEIPEDFPLIDDRRFEHDAAAGAFGLTYGADWYAVIPLQAQKNADPTAEWMAYPVPSADSRPSLVSVDGMSILYHFVARKGMEDPDVLVKLAGFAAAKQYGDRADPHTFVTDPELGAVWKYSIVSVALQREHIKRHYSVVEALRNGDPADLDPQARDVYDKIDRYRRGDTSQWCYDRWFGIDGSAGIAPGYVRNDQVLFDEYVGPKDNAFLEVEADLEQLWRRTVVRIILGADLEEYDRFVSEWYRRGGDELTRRVNEWYAKRRGLQGL